MRKFVLAAFAMFVCVGLTMAAQVTFMKYDAAKKEVTVKEGDAEKTYKISDKAKVWRGDMEFDLEKALKNWEKNGEKMAGKSKMEVTVKDGEITEIKMAAPKKKDK
jgi:uncharacterized protein with FMN-binding domain